MNEQSDPICSILMSVYKEDDFLLKRSIESVLKQTLYSFEFIIIDDGMTESNIEIIKSFGDNRIQLVKNKVNLGLTRSLNKAAALASGEYLVRLDSDDYCLQSRLEDQVQFMKRFPKLVLSGGRESVVIEDGFIDSKVKFTNKNEKILKCLSTYNPFIHSTLIIKKNIFDQIGGYDESVRYAQDYDLIFRISKIGEIDNMDKVLVFRVLDDKSISIKKQRNQMYYALKTRMKAFLHYGGDKAALWAFFRSMVVLTFPRFFISLLRGIKS